MMQRVKPVVPKPKPSWIGIIIILRMMMMIEHSYFTKSIDTNEPNQIAY